MSELLTDELDNPTHIHEGQDAWRRLRDYPTWEDWKKVGAAHVIGRATAMRDGKINKPKGRSYNAAFSAWQKKFGFEELDKSDRARLFSVMDHLADIEAYLGTLNPAERLRLNHPASIWRRFKAATAQPKEKASPVQKLKDTVAKLDEEIFQLKREKHGRDLWALEDEPQEIARAVVGKLSKDTAEKVAREILKILKTTKKECA